MSEEPTLNKPANGPFRSGQACFARALLNSEDGAETSVAVEAIYEVSLTSGKSTAVLGEAYSPQALRLR
jgi:hypothetical protein